MKSRSNIGAALVAAAIAVSGWAAYAVALHAQEQPAASGRLAVVWTSGDPDVAHRMALMYTHAAKSAGWFGEVRLVVWGPSARLLAGDKDLQAKVQEMLADGVDVDACVVCAESYGVADRLRELGLDVLPMGAPLSDMLQSDWKVITF